MQPFKPAHDNERGLLW